MESRRSASRVADVDLSRAGLPTGTSARSSERLQTRARRRPRLLFQGWKTNESPVPRSIRDDEPAAGRGQCGIQRLVCLGRSGNHAVIGEI